MCLTLRSTQWKQWLPTRTLRHLEFLRCRNSLTNRLRILELWLHKKLQQKTIWTLRMMKKMLMTRRLKTKSKKRKWGSLKLHQTYINQMLRKRERKEKFNGNCARKRLKSCWRKKQWSIKMRMRIAIQVSLRLKLHSECSVLKCQMNMKFLITCKLTSPKSVSRWFS